MNMIDKIIDSQSINGPSLGQTGPVMISLPDFRTRPDSFLNSSSGGYFPDNLFLLNPNLFNRALNPSSTFNELNSNFKLPLTNPSLETEGEKSSEEEDFCEKCQKRFCNKYYLRKHKIDVHKTECDLPNPLDSSNIVGSDIQQKSPLFQPSMFNPLFNSSFSNFLLQKSIGPIFPNINFQLPTSSLPSSLTQQNSEFSLSSVSNPSPVFSQSGFRMSQPCPLITTTDIVSTCSNTFSNNLTPINENRITNITTSIFDENKNNTFMKLPTETKSFSISSMESSFRDQIKPVQHISCNICGIQLTGGETVLLDHLFACHNKENLNNSSSIPKLMPKKEPTPPLLNTTNESYISPFDAFKSSMAAAKLADRVTCDICHKDLCNKYFLRTHKLKLHGVQTLDSTGRTGNRKEKSGFFERCSNSIDQLNTNSNFIGTPFSRNPLPDPLLAASLFTNTPKPRPSSPETGCFCPICKRLISLPYFLPLHMWNAHGIGMGSHTSIMPSVCTSRSNFDPTILEPAFMPGSLPSKINPTLFPLSFCNNNLDTNLGSKWYRKSPNQMRVRCDICDKWICNKYFLRTHKLNKHGLTDNGSNTDVNSDSISRNFFIDSSTVPNTSSTGTDPSDNQINVANPIIENDGSPIDLSSSPLRNNQPSLSTTSTSTFQSDKSTSVTASQNMTGFNINSLWNTRINFPWPLRFSIDRLNLPSLIHSSSKGSLPLDLSMKAEESQHRKKDNSTMNKESESSSFKYRSVLFNAAKRLKVKYQKIYRSRYLHNAFLSTRKNCHLMNHPNNQPVGILDCLSCPLCGKELNDAASFLQHLTQFHDMVLPGNHSNPVTDVC